MSTAVIITVTSMIISTVSIIAALWICSIAINRSEADRDKQIALAVERIKTIRKSLTATTDTAINQHNQDQRSIEYLTLQIDALTLQLERERSATIN